MKVVRFILGKIILFLDSITTPTGKVRSAPDQATADAMARSLVLYQLPTCPFCVKVRRELKRLSIELSLKDVGTDANAHRELMEGGKIDQVPCLKITETDGKISWMYESGDINAYLQKRFA